MQHNETGQWNHPEANVKMSLATRAVPLERVVGLAQMQDKPRVGDLVLATVSELGRHRKIENRAAVNVDIFPGDRLVIVLGNRYATDQYEGYVPHVAPEMLDLLSVGGVCGRLVSRHGAIGKPTELRVEGAMCDSAGRPLNSRAFGVRKSSSIVASPGTETIVVIGASMNAGKTTTVGTIVRALRQHGHRVAAAKVTGTASSKDMRFFQSCGARPVVDFVDAGYPSTYMLEEQELEDLYFTMRNQLLQAKPDYAVIELADGIFQRETEMLLGSQRVLESIDHCIFAAGDSLGIQSGARFAQEFALPLRATSGIVSQSPLGIREAEAAGGVPCLSIDRMMDGRLLDVLGNRPTLAERDETPASAVRERLATRSA